MKYTVKDLLRYCLSNNVDEIKKAIDSGVDINYLHENGGTTLNYVCRSDRDLSHVVELLLKNGANPNLRYNIQQWTPLMNACNNPIKSIRTIGLLLEYGAKSNAVTDKGYDSCIETPLSIAIRNLYPIQLLIELRDHQIASGIDKELLNQSFYNACVVQNLEYVRMFISEADVNFRSLSFGWTPLQALANSTYPDMEIAKLLIKSKDIDLQLVNKDMDVLDCALQSFIPDSNYDFIKLLLDNGLKVRSYSSTHLKHLKHFKTLDLLKSVAGDKDKHEIK